MENNEFNERPEIKPAESVPLPKAKGGNGAKLLCVLLAVIIVGLGTFIACDKLLPKDGEKCVVNVPEEEKKEQQPDERYVLELKLQDLMGKLREKMNNAFGSEYKIASVTYGDRSAVVRPGDEDFLTGGGEAYEVTTGDMQNPLLLDKLMNNEVNLKNIMTNSLKEDGFAEYPSMNNYYWNSTYLESEDGIGCIVTAAQMVPFSVICGSKKDVTEEKTNLVVSLAKAYKVSSNENIGYIDANVGDIVNGADGYQHINATGSDAAYIFYRSSEDAEWLFFTATQQAIGCDGFNTDDLKKAFAGERCWTSGGDESIVK